MLRRICTPQAGRQSLGDAELAVPPPLPGSRDSLPPLWEGLELILLLGHEGAQVQQEMACSARVLTLTALHGASLACSGEPCTLPAGTSPWLSILNDTSLR